MKKKLLSLFLSMLLIFSFVACGKSQEKERHDFCTYSEWTTTKQATCLNPGTQERHCTICGNKETRNIPITDNHTISNGKCTSCGEITNAYDAFAYYISQKGDYDVEYKHYILLIGLSYSEGYEYSRAAIYDPNTNELSINILLDNAFYLTIELKRNSSIYEYGIVYNSYYMIGSFYPSSFSSYTTSLSYTSTNATSSLLTDFREVGADLASIMLFHLTEDIEDSGITAKDLGFANY